MTEPISATSIAATRRPARSRARICAALAIVIAVGVASRLGAGHLPALPGKEFGDALWSLMFFLFVLLVWPRASALAAALLALGVSFAIEFLKLYHAPYVDRLRAGRVAGFLMGHKFLWRDFVAYGVGVVGGAVIDALWSRCRL